MSNLIDLQINETSTIAVTVNDPDGDDYNITVDVEGPDGVAEYNVTNDEIRYSHSVTPILTGRFKIRLQKDVGS